MSLPLFEWQWATMDRKTQIVQDESEVCVSGSWFISRPKCLGLCDVHRVQSADGANAADMVCNFLKHWECTENLTLDGVGILYLEVHYRGFNMYI